MKTVSVMIIDHVKNIVSRLNHSINVDIILKHDKLEVNVDNRRCIVNRLPE